MVGRRERTAARRVGRGRSVHPSWTSLPCRRRPRDEFPSSPLDAAPPRLRLRWPRTRPEGLRARRGLRVSLLLIRRRHVDPVTAPVRFELVATEGEARRGHLITPHGAVDTPAFMPVATQGSVKSLDPGDLRSAGAQIILANTYHLHLRPGHELVRDLGGLHRFMGWEGPILTDSGGFQVFSLSKLRRLGEEGVEFRSHLDGSVRLLTPEICMDIQHALGVDILPPLDECLPHAVSFADTERSLALTVRWLERAVARHRAKDSAGALFGIVQGGGYEALRRRAVEETKARLYDITQLVASHLPVDRPRYLMGVGKPVDLIEAVARGVDLFDCVLPTRNARNGQAFTAEGT